MKKISSNLLTLLVFALIVITSTAIVYYPYPVHAQSRVVPTIQYNASVPSVPNGGYTPAQSDSQGDLKFYMSSAIAGEDITNNVLGTIAKYPVVSTYSPSSYQSASSGAQVVQANIKATAGVLVSLSVSNANAGVRYLWITNSASSPSNALASSDASVVYIYALMGTSARDITIPAGKYFPAGISFGFSTSATSFTAATAADHTLNANYF